MLRVIEVVGLLAPLAGLALIVGYRKSVPMAAMWLGVLGCLLAGSSSVVGLAAKPTLIFDAASGSGLTGMIEGLGQIAMLRIALLALGIAALVAAAVLGRGGDNLPTGWLLGAGGSVAVGGLVALLTSGAEHRLAQQDHEGLALIAALLGEVVQFGALGLGVLALAIAVTTGRQADGAPRRDSAAVAAGVAKSAWSAYQSLRR